MASLGCLNTPRRPDFPASMLVHSLVSLPTPQKPEEVRDDMDVEPWSEGEFEAGTIDPPGSPRMATTCPPSTSRGSQALDTDSPDMVLESSPPSKSSNFYASFDSGVILAELPEHVPRAPDGRTHRLYVQYLDQYLQDMQLDKRGFRLAVLRRRRRDFLADSWQARCASLLPMSRRRPAQGLGSRNSHR